MPTLQEQINVASSGVTIQHDTEFVGNLIINKPITIQGSGMIRTPNAGPAIDISPRTGPVTLKGGLKICTTPGWAQVYDIVRYGAWQTTSLADVPQGLTLEHVDIFGQPSQEVQRGIAANGANFVMRRSKVREVHGKNSECQAIAAWNGPGPFTVEDSYLEASHICLLFGGAEARISNLVPRGIKVLRTHFFRPMTWRGVYPCKNHVEFKNAEDVLLDGCVAENCWVSAQIGFSILLTVRNEDGKNPWAIVKNVRIQNMHVKNVAGGVQLIGKDTNAAGVVGSGDRASFFNVLFELSSEMGGNGRLVQSQDFHNLSFDRIEANPSHSFLNLSGAPVPGLSVTNSLLSQGQWGYFGDGDRPLTVYAPDGKVNGNQIYGEAIPDARRLAGNTYSWAKPSVLPSGVGVDYAALRAAQTGGTTTPTPQPAPQPAPTPIPTPSPDGTKAKTITDNSGGVWTLGPREETLRNGIHMHGGAGSMYKWFGGNVYVLGGDNAWWKWATSSWVRVGAEPGVTEPTPTPAPQPTPTPVPSIRSIPWPKQISKQNTILQTQWKERYFLKGVRDGISVIAEFERVP